MAVWCLCVQLPHPSYPHHLQIHHRLLHSLMSRANPTTSSSPNFQLIFDNALEAYKKRTKNDLLAHPLVAQLQNCHSPTAVLTLIHNQVQGVHQSQRADDRLTRWLDPTVRVLYAFSGTLGEGVSLVGFRKFISSPLFHIHFPGILSRESDLCRSQCSSLSAYPSLYSCAGY